MGYGDTVINMFVAIGVFFVLMPFVIHNSHESKSLLKLIFIFGIYAAIMYVFISGSIYETGLGPYLQEFKDIIELK